MALYLAHHYEPWLVVLSVAIALLASYTTLDLLGRARDAAAGLERLWLLCSAATLGVGVWSMHFVAMLAFGLDSPVAYDMGGTLVSLFLAVVITGSGLFVAHHRAGDSIGVGLGGILMGLGMVALHYSGMAAMRVPADLHYDGLLVGASVLIAILASPPALWLAFRRLTSAQRICAALVMGTAMLGLHYTAMEAVGFMPHGGPHGMSGAILGQETLAVIIAMVTFLILLLALLAAMVDRQSALRRSEDRLRLALQTGQTGIWEWDTKTGRVTWSDTNERLFGMPAGSFEGSTADFLARVHVDDRARIHAEICASLKKRKPFATDLRIIRLDGGVRYLHMRGEVIRDAAGQPLRMSGANIDITERHLAEAALRQLNEELEQRVEAEVAVRQRAEAALRQAQKMEAVGQLTGGVAHDFNNILTAIAGNLYLIERAASDHDRIRQLAASAQRAAERAARVISQLLSFSRQQMLRPQNVDVGDLAGEFLGFLHRTLHEAIEIELRADAGLWACHIDPAQFQSALLNLALNARDAMPQGGRLRIEARNIMVDEKMAAMAADLSPGSYVLLTVTDTGRGMAPEVIERAFDPFFTTKDLGKGTGLGLSMVYGFVKQSGGHVTIQSALGEGTTISLYLPKAEGAAEIGTSSLPAARQIVPGSGTVLVVEDEESVLQVISASLRELGYTVLTAQNSAEALPLLERGEKIDLLISDVIIPRSLNGVELARKVKERQPDIKVLLTSGYAGDTLDRLDARDEFLLLRKPFRQVELLHHLRTLLGHPPSLDRDLATGVPASTP